MTSPTRHDRRAGRLGSLLALVLGFAVLLVTPSAAGATASAPWVAPMADQARSFNVTFEVAEDGSVLVTERISWEFPSGEARRGIERLVTTSVGYQDRDDVYRTYPISDITASSPTGAAADVHLSDFGSVTRIRVGDPDQTVS